jgi:hypothetical protein
VVEKLMLQLEGVENCGQKKLREDAARVFCKEDNAAAAAAAAAADDDDEEWRIVWTRHSRLRR